MIGSACAYGPSSVDCSILSHFWCLCIYGWGWSGGLWRFPWFKGLLPAHWWMKQILALHCAAHFLGTFLEVTVCLDSTLLCLWFRLGFTVLIWPLAWVPPYFAVCVALKQPKNKTNKQINKNKIPKNLKTQKKTYLEKGITDLCKPPCH